MPYIFYRPGVAGAVLWTTLSLIHWFIHSQHHTLWKYLQSIITHRSLEKGTWIFDIIFPTSCVSCDTWWGVNILSKFQLPSYYSLGQCLEDSERIGSPTEWMNQWINDKGVCRTAPATPGLLISKILAWTFVGKNYE